MRINEKIIAEFYGDTGRSVYGFTNKYGTFMGEALCHPEETKQSTFFGVRLSRLRAIQKMYNEKLKLLRYQIKAIENCLVMLQQTKRCNIESEEYKQVNKFLTRMKEEYDTLKKAKDDIKKAQGNLIETRKNTLNKISLMQAEKDVK